MPLWVDIVVKLTPAFITLVVGMIASLIAFLQYKTARDKFRLDMFSKRLEAFEKLQEYFSNVFRQGCVKDEALQVLAEARYKSRFIFGPEIEKSFDELWKKAVDMRGLRVRLQGSDSLPVGPERTAACEKESVLLRWTIEQMTTAHQRYVPYMRFGK